MQHLYVVHVYRALETVFEALYQNTSAEAAAVLNKYIDWTPEAAAVLQESVPRGNVIAYCTSDQGVSDIHTILYYTHTIISIAAC